jgi:hypothetical protein
MNGGYSVVRAGVIDGGDGNIGDVASGRCGAVVTVSLVVFPENVVIFPSPSVNSFRTFFIRCNVFIFFDFDGDNLSAKVIFICTMVLLKLFDELMIILFFFPVSNLTTFYSRPFFFLLFFLFEGVYLF